MKKILGILIVLLLLGLSYGCGRSLGPDKDGRPDIPEESPPASMQ